jgi:hypothetical protein
VAYAVAFPDAGWTEGELRKKRNQHKKAFPYPFNYSRLGVADIFSSSV